jgi:hypothetical protein
VFYFFKECSSRAPSEITLYPLTSPWAGLIIGDLWQIAPNKFWALQQTDFSCNNTVPRGPVVGRCALGFSRSCHLPSFGLTADGPCGLVLVCHNLGKKWASTKGFAANIVTHCIRLKNFYFGQRLYVHPLKEFQIQTVTMLSRK